MRQVGFFNLFDLFGDPSRDEPARGKGGAPQGASPPAAPHTPPSAVAPRQSPVPRPVVAERPPQYTASTPSPSHAWSVEFVRNPRARRYLIRVRVDGTVRVTIPNRGSKREADDFYRQNQAWVAAQQQRIAQIKARMPQDLSADEQKRLRARAARELPARLHELAAPLGLTVKRVSVRNQRQRWGSCSTSGLITLNWRLVTMPDWVRDYVIYHELMHLRRMDHSPTFWKHVASVCPRYKEARTWLRRHGLAPHAAGEAGTADEVD